MHGETVEICILLEGSYIRNDLYLITPKATNFLHDILYEICRTLDCFRAIYSCVYDSEQNRVKSFTVFTPLTSLTL